MVPEATFTSYYGRPIVKPSPWEADIPAYLFAGGLAAGSSLIAAGADLTNRPTLRRSGRLGAIAALTFSMVALVHDLGRPARFLNMLRVAKLTSPMSVGTWILSLYGPFAGAAAATEVVGMLPARYRVGPLKLAPYVDRPAGRPGRAVRAAGGRLHRGAARRHRDAFVARGVQGAAVRLRRFRGRGLGRTRPGDLAGRARRARSAGWRSAAPCSSCSWSTGWSSSMGITAEPLHQGKAGRLMKAAKVLTIAGAAGSLLAGRSRAVAVLSGTALLAGSACTRFGVFEAGQASAKDPKYTVVPQRERLERGEPVRFDRASPTR